MNTLIKAAQDVIELYSADCDIDRAIEALRQAVADSDKGCIMLWHIYAGLVTKNSSILKIEHGIVPTRLNNKSMQKWA